MKKLFFVLACIVGCGPGPEKNLEPPPNDMIENWPALLEAEDAIFALAGVENDVFFVFDDRVERIDLTNGTVRMRAVVPSPVRRVAVSDDRIYVLTGADGNPTSEIIVLDLESGTDVATLTVPFAEEIKLLSNGKLFLATEFSGAIVDRDEGRVDAEVRFSPGLIYGSFGIHEVDGRVHVPRAYPGGIDVIRIDDGAVLETIPVNDWIHDVKKLGDRFVVTGHIDGLSIVRPGAGDDIRIDIGTTFASHVLPLTERSALVLAAGKVYEIDIDGEIIRSAPLPDSVHRPDDEEFQWRFDDWILRSYAGRALVFVRGKGAVWIDLSAQS